MRLLICSVLIVAASAQAATAEFRTLPIQSRGRLMPIDTYARVGLLELSGLGSIKADGERIDPMTWLLRVLFDTEKAKEDALFLVENPEILDALGLGHEKARDRYSFNLLWPRFAILRNLAAEADRIPAGNRSLFQRQCLTLYHKLNFFDRIARSFEFWSPVAALGVEEARPHLPDNATIEDYLAYMRALGGGQTASDVKHRAAVERDVFALVQSQYSPEFAVFARHPDGGEVWASPWDIFLRGADEDKAILAEIQRGRSAFRQGKMEEVQEALNKAAEGLLAAAGQRPELGTLVAEVLYNQSQVFFWTKLSYGLATLVCALSWLGKSGRTAVKASTALCWLAFLLHTAGLCLRMYIKGRPPVTTLYESMLFVAWAGTLFALFAEKWSRKTLALFSGALMGTILLFIAGRYETDGDTMGVLVAVLDSNFWLSTHVTTITLGYAACLLAGAMGHISIFAEIVSPGRSLKLRTELNRLIYGIIAAATLLSFLGTILGGIWADQSWGRFWGWDPKENGALLIVLWNSILLHARLGGYIGKTGMAVGAVFGNVVVAAAWWGVNLLQIGLHSYGFDDGVFKNLAIFGVSQVVVMALGGVAYLRGRIKAPQPADVGA